MFKISLLFNRYINITFIMPFNDQREFSILYIFFTNWFTGSVVNLRKWFFVNLTLDDFGLKGLDNINKHSFMEIIEDRHGKKSTIIASQLSVEAWHDIIGEQTIADAILDSLVHKAHRINIKGGSIRKNYKIYSKFNHKGIDFDHLVCYAHFHLFYLVHFDRPIQLRITYK